MSIYNSNVAFPKDTGFSSANGVVLCGFAQDTYNFGKTAQASVGSVAVNTLLSCTAVIIKNDTATATGTGNMQGMNPDSLTITKVVAAQEDIVSGFVVESPSMLVNDAGVAGVPLEGGRVSVALIGSGVEIYLPANADVIGVEVGAQLYWSYSNKELTKTQSTNATLKDVVVLSSVVDGLIRQPDGSWKSVKCVKVRL